MKIKSREVAHKIAEHPHSAVAVFFTRCGRNNCKCARGKEHWHGPYGYVRQRKNGRRSKQYVRAADIDTATLAYQSRKLQERDQRAFTEASTESWRSLRDFSREVERGLKGD